MRAAVVILVLVGVGTLLSSIARLLDVGEDRHMVAVASFLYALLFAVAFPSIVRRAFQHRDVTLEHARRAGIVGLPDHRALRSPRSTGDGRRSTGGEFFDQPRAPPGPATSSTSASSR